MCMLSKFKLGLRVAEPATPILGRKLEGMVKTSKVSVKSGKLAHQSEQPGSSQVNLLKGVQEFFSFYMKTIGPLLGVKIVPIIFGERIFCTPFMYVKIPQKIYRSVI